MNIPADQYFYLAIYILLPCVLLHLLYFEISLKFKKDKFKPKVINILCVSPALGVVVILFMWYQSLGSEFGALIVFGMSPFIILLFMMTGLLFRFFYKKRESSLFSSEASLNVSQSEIIIIRELMRCDECGFDFSADFFDNKDNICKICYENKCSEKKANQNNN